MSPELPDILAHGLAGYSGTQVDRTADSIIVGGGIAGLAAAHRFGSVSPGCRVLLVERSPHVGGWIQTDHAEGFTIEHGPDSFLSTKPRGTGLAGEVGLGDSLEGVDERTRATFIMRGGKLYPLPQGLSGLVPARLGPLARSPLLSPLGRARLAVEPFVPVRGGTDDESLGQFMRRRFGREAYERLIEPLASGIYGGNGDRISLLATFPQLRNLEQKRGSVLRGLREGPHTGGDRPRSPFVAPRAGMAAFARAVADVLPPGSVSLSRAAARVDRTNGGFKVGLDDDTVLYSRSVIIATPAFVTAALLERMHPELARLHESIPYGSVATVSLAFGSDAETATRGHGYIIPRAEGRPLMAITFSSRKFRHRAPDGRVLVRGFVRPSESAENGLRSDEDLVSMTRDELHRTCGIEASPILARVYRLPRSMPHYQVGHADLVAAMEEHLRSTPGLLLAGAAYRGVGIPDCIASGEQAAEAAAVFLRNQ